MVEREAPRAPEAVRASAVIGAGDYRVNRQRIILRTPAAVHVEPETPESAETARLEAEQLEALLHPPEPDGPSQAELAEREAEAVRASAREEAGEIRRESREQGYTEGLKEGMEVGRAEGREQGLRELREALDRWLTMGDALTEAWRARFEGLENEVKDLAMAAAEKLVEGHLALAPDSVIGVVRDALRHAAEADLVTVLISPKDAALVRAAKEELAAVLKGTGRFEIIEEAKIEPGSCLVETKTQVIDATRKTRVEQLRGALGGGGV